MADQPSAGQPPVRPASAGPAIQARLERLDTLVPLDVQRVLDRLWRAGHAAYVVGGGLRDALLDRSAADWDVASDARPERLLTVFPGSRYQNRFGTVVVPADLPTGTVEVTTFRRDHAYRDRRRPDSITFSDSLEADLARRDFTVNAIAWGQPASPERDAPPPGVASIVDPTGGLADLASSTLRAVGDPHRRFDEDALRLLRAVRLAAQLKFSIEPQTLDALRAAAPLTVYVSRERVGQEVRRMLQARPPSRGFRLLESTGLLEARFPILAAQRGLPQVKVRGDDLWDHALRTLDAAAEHDPDDEILLLAALLHDIGKPGTRADGHFLGHDQLGSELAMDILTGLAFPRAEIDEVAALVRNHMFGYTPAWSDAAVRRFIRRVGTHRLPRLFALRAADNLGSGMEPDAGGLADLRARTEAELARKPPLEVRDLAIDGRDLQSELGMKPGPRIGAILERLLDSVIADPRRNRRETLIADARAWTNGS